MAAAIAYQEPTILTILIQSSFLLVLNLFNYLLDRAIYCGLVAQIFVGIAWGTPGGKLLGEDAEMLITQLGYLGLILLVYEGGLSTDISAINANFYLSIGVAITGICLPVAFSFALLSLMEAAPLQAFAAGAALCSTSLGTIFSVLSTSQLTTTRLGTVLTTAAMLDDVVGLIMVQVISDLGKASVFSAPVVIRPIAVSIGFVVVLLLLCRFVVTPVTSWRNEKNIPTFLEGNSTAIMSHTLILIGMVAGASYAGTSNLFAAYLTGASVTWWDGEASHDVPQPSEAKPGAANVTAKDMHGPVNATQSPISDRTSTLQTGEKDVIQPEAQKNQLDTSNPQKKNRAPELDPPTPSGTAIFNTYFAPTVNKILKPFFFASIGFAVPITQMFNGAIVWRSLVYTILMLLGKLLTGLWLVRISSPISGLPASLPFSRIRTVPRLLRSCWYRRTTTSPTNQNNSNSTSRAEEPKPQSRQPNRTSPYSAAPNDTRLATSTANTPAYPPPNLPAATPKPLSLYPPVILGLAMVSRGEIGFLIASVAESEGIFSSSSSNGNAPEEQEGPGASKIFLVVVWAILLCTMIGPVGVGILVKRVRALQARRTGEAREDVLGVWGVG